MGRTANQYVKLLILLIFFLCLAPEGAETQVPGDPPAVATNRYVGGFTSPVHITHAGDGSGRLFVVEQPGRIRIVKDGRTLPTSFLDISGRVSCCGERGLLSVTFPPGYAAKGHFYVDYTNPAGDTVVARYRLSADPDVADASTEEILLTIAQPYANHNGGQLAFGPDGYLYIGMGDGGSGGDPLNNGQNTNVLLGKLLKIDVEAGIAPYAIPATNPYRLLAGYRPEIWALGLRNPWRFSFDRLTGDLYIGDVGQNMYEEIDFQPAASTGGENYGWRIMEGFHCYDPPTCNPNGLTLPVAEYDHSLGNCSVTGGGVYRGGFYPNLFGFYLYGDYCSGRIWGLKRNGDTWQNSLLLDTPYTITTFGEDEAGTIYFSDYTNGDIYLMSDALGVMPLPTGTRAFSYPAETLPTVSIDPALAKPIATGLDAFGGPALNLRIALPQLGGSADIYFGVYAPYIDTSQLYLLTADNRLAPLSSGVVRWKEKTTGPMDELPFGTIPISALQSGPYYLYLLVTPAGDLSNYYLWTTSFSVP
ncbi:MAG: PQQ-dependent sugar dehydrogenase [Deltaproteobacteria bacterium]|nr:PQQ-dependent sugar dehydrogenase [Deltaproteobacteria bacterium]